MLVGGVDVGSLSTDVVLLREGKICAGVVIPTGANSKETAQKAMEAALKEAGATWEELSFVVATGYGRARVPFAQKSITEISCHARGAAFLFPHVQTVIDVGGQDSKVIRTGPRGKVLDFVMNEKCAAGTGRFLEVMARALEVDLVTFTSLAEKSRRAATITSMCTVFAESEVVSLIAAGVSPAEIARGLNVAMAGRIASLARRVGVEEPVVMTGGVAKNKGVVESLARQLGVTIKVPPEPQLVGALGAALLALKEEEGD